MESDPTTLFFGLGIFFVFIILGTLLILVTIILVALIRYSNQELGKKMAAIFDKIKNSEKDLRQLAETQMSSKKDLSEEIEKLRAEIAEIKGTKEIQKQLARIGK